MFHHEHDPDDCPHCHHFTSLAERMIAVMATLAEAVTHLQTSVDAAVAKFATPDPSVQQAADTVDALASQLDQAVNPPTV